jgi:AbrB family transcriptional regulator, transcriptional pleiotropic regulator of transition state genes
MKATGVVRQVDQIGRVVIPIELRRIYGVDIKNLVEIFVDGECAILQKNQPGCMFCKESGEGVREFNGKHVCPNCITEMGSLTSK